MRFVDRFTRDEFSAKVWWPFTMVLLVLFVLTFPAEHRAVDARHRDTAAVDAALSQRVIEPNVVSALASSSITGTLGDALTEEVHDEILVNDDRIKAVRIWSPQHVLLWSDPHGPLDSAHWLNDGDIDAATAAAGAPTWLVTHRTPTNEPGPATYYSYTAIGTQPLVTSFEYRDATLTSDVRASWLGYQIAIGLGLLLAFAFSLLSMREPMAEIGTGVPFYAGSVPQDLTLMEVERAVAIEQAGDRIKERTASLQHKLEASEAARLRAEGRLQQALAALAQPGRRSRMPVPEPTPVTHEVVEVPELDSIVVAAAEPEAVVVARAKPTSAPRGRSLVVPKKERARKPKPKPRPRPVAAPAPKPSVPKPVVETPEPAPQRPVVETPQPEPAPIVPPPDPAPIDPPPDPIITPEPEPVSVAKVEPSDAGGSPEVVVVPELQPVGTPAGPESASDLLDRLVERVPENGSTEAPRDLRAKLARTAALKKPGSKERREADEQQQRS
ncbi:MAG: hypothetical protein M3P43_10280 [Actinomycetota bacterium]|nr:hypothetical protein [Actinomycetota bacterium]